jgi:Glutaredoxin-like domain (DUF836)
VSAPPRVVVWSRADCPLCDELLEALAPLLAAHGASGEVRDVDADPVALRRYKHKVPVVEVDGLVACHGHLDAAEVERLLRPR